MQFKINSIIQSHNNILILINVIFIPGIFRTLFEIASLYGVVTVTARSLPDATKKHH